MPASPPPGSLPDHLIDPSAAAITAGDPEAALSAQASRAMEPVTGPYLHDVVTGRMAASGMPQDHYDPTRSFAQNALDPQALEQATNMALSVGPGAIRAWHASPHDFSRFDLSKVGTGQGAATYGHGIYAAESPAVSGPGGAYDLEFTAKNLGKSDLNQGEANILRMLRAGQSDMEIMSDLAQNGYSFDEAVSSLSRMKDARAKLYEVNINAEPQQFLDWDKPLAQQPSLIQQLKRDYLDSHYSFTPSGFVPTGQDLYSVMASKLGGTRQKVTPSGSYDLPFSDEAAASAALRKAGVPGIRYLDQGSRAAGDGSRNYVVTDDNLIEILRKYGLLGTLGGGAAAAAGGEAQAGEPTGDISGLLGMLGPQP